MASWYRSTRGGRVEKEAEPEKVLWVLEGVRETRGQKLSNKMKLGAMAVFGIAAFTTGWIKGHVSGIKVASRTVEKLRRYAECRGTDGCDWVYPPGHPREQQPFGDRLDEHSNVGSHPVEREVRRYRPFAGLRLLETIEFDLARPLPDRHMPPGVPPWWERPTGGTGWSEYQERMRRKDERVQRQRAALERLRRRLFGGLRIAAQSRRRLLAADNRSRRSLTLTVDVTNTALVSRQTKELRLTYIYQHPLTERLFGRTTPRVPLARLESQQDPPPKLIAPGETVQWTAIMKEVGGDLVDSGLSTWPDTRLMRLNDPLSEWLARRGGLSLWLVNLLRRLNFWRFAVEFVDDQGRWRKAEVHEVAPWEG